MMCIGMLVSSNFVSPASAESGLRKQLIEIQQRSKAQYRIRVYGRDSSPACSAFREKLDEAGIIYEYMDISKNRDARTEMWSLIHRKNSSAVETNLPVVKAGSVLMTAPSFEEVSALIKEKSECEQNDPSAAENSSCETVLYGRDSCSRCASIQAKLDEAHIPYKYMNLDDSSSVSEMWKAVRAAKPGTKKVLLPVLNVKGTILVNPEFMEVKKALRSSGTR